MERSRNGFGLIGGCLLPRKLFVVEKTINRAQLRATALGVCRLCLDAAEVGDVHLIPGWTDYRKRGTFANLI